MRALRSWCCGRPVLHQHVSNVKLLTRPGEVRL